MVSLVNSPTNATRIGKHLWEIVFRFAPGLPPGWCRGAFALHVLAALEAAALADGAVLHTVLDLRTRRFNRGECS